MNQWSPLLLLILVVDDLELLLGFLLIQTVDLILLPLLDVLGLKAELKSFQGDAFDRVVVVLLLLDSNLSFLGEDHHDFVQVYELSAHLFGDFNVFRNVPLVKVLRLWT